MTVHLQVIDKALEEDLSDSSRQYIEDNHSLEAAVDAYEAEYRARIVESMT